MAAPQRIWARHWAGMMISRKLRDQLLSGGLPQIVAQASKFLDEIEKKEQDECIAVNRMPIPVATCRRAIFIRWRVDCRKRWSLPRYLPDLRWRHTTRASSGLNLVMAEDWYVPIHDFNLHMQMIDFLHSLIPKSTSPCMPAN